MPKVVNHDQRRTALVEATWRIIARLGIEGTTMRQIAAEAGFANGALKPYFPTKDDLLSFAFGHVFGQTSQRMLDVTADRTGLARLRAYCHEILPLDDTRISEARIVIPFWQRALTDPAKANLHNMAMQEWRQALQACLTQAREAGEIHTTLVDDDIVGHLMTVVLGAQITALLTPAEHSPERLISQLDGYLKLLVSGD
ncbi:TetR/AcrR family transcriptional regulator [Cryobacterium psychrophilum]|uniref:TetR family transcriptional regulator n=1 Tax=Cryobacterium psychrophilum TaxID=41988 RepID=A0A4Y8KVU1_9MICO|nr:TetR family transcriptional regulator C-terminal domain-containing protein [Cryobacterium psychrophilum]TDW29615.1 TetR family transcriptional regulator [Cryobacterium psychrophilum]TFD81740.1 TetR family transcriptional regulator [Cryobacterium psychrophilum]